MAEDRDIEWETTREEQERMERAKVENARLAGAVEALARTKDGLFFLRWLVETTMLLQEIPPANDSYMHYFEGKRSIGLHLMRLIRDARCAEAVLADEEDI